MYQYDHIDPPFSEARLHDPERIALVCANDHDRHTRRQLSVETLRAAMLQPRAKQKGFSFGAFDIGSTHPDIVIGRLRVVGAQTVIRAFGERILAIEPPEQQGSPFRISAMLRDRRGQEMLRIDANEWKTRAENWDVEVTGATITIRAAPSDIVLTLRTAPPDALHIERLQMAHNGAQLSWNAETTEVAVQSPDGSMISLRCPAALMEGARVALDITKIGISIGRP